MKPAPCYPAAYWLRLVLGLILAPAVAFWLWLLGSLAWSGQLDAEMLDGLLYSTFASKNIVMGAGLNLVVVLAVWGVLLPYFSPRRQLVILVVTEAALGAAWGSLTFDTGGVIRLLGTGLAGGLGGAVAWSMLYLLPRDEDRENDGDPPDARGRRAALGRLAAGLGTLGAAGAVATVIPPLRIIAHHRDAVDVDIAGLAPGELRFAEIDNRTPVWIFRRSAAQLAALQAVDPRLVDPGSHDSSQPDAARNPWRALRPEIGIYIPLCTHLGCLTNWLPDGPTEENALGRQGQFLCPCHGGVFDLAGRAVRNTVVTRNLDVPRHEYLSDTVVRIYFSELGTLLRR